MLRPGLVSPATWASHQGRHAGVRSQEVIGTVRPESNQTALRLSPAAGRGLALEIEANYSYERMNDLASTPATLVAAARELFARHGYDGTSVRMITDAAGANLGAITYHFGSKEALYGAVVASVAEPLYARVRTVAAGAGSALDRLARILEAYFAHFADHPDMPKLVVQQIFTERPLPAPLRDAMGGILAAIAGVIAEGQAAGTIRPGQPILLALSTLAQPIYFNIVRRPLAEAGVLDLADRRARGAIVTHVVQFALRGLATRPETLA